MRIAIERTQARCRTGAAVFATQAACMGVRPMSYA